MRITGSKRFFLLVMLMGIFSFLFGCGKTQEPMEPESVQNVEIDVPAELSDGVKLTGFYMNQMGMIMKPYYVFKATANGSYMKITDTCPDEYLMYGVEDEDALIQPAEYFGRVDTVMENEHARLVCLEDEGAVRQLESCILAHGALNWDGYDESVSKKGVSDSGTNYQLYLEFSDGKTVKMRGYNVCPHGFLELYQEVSEIFEAEMENTEVNRIGDGIEPKVDDAGNETASRADLLGEEPSDMMLAERICGSYLYRPAREDAYEEYLVEFRYLNEKLVAEVSFQQDFDSVYSRHMAEFWPVSEDILTGTSENACRFAVREFSGFSMEGEYWGPEAFSELVVVEDGLVCRMEDYGAEYVLERLVDVPKMHSEDMLREYFGQIVEAEMMDADELREMGIFGEWYASVMVDGSEAELYLQLEENGLMWFMRKCAGEPMELYRGAYGMESGEDCLALHVTAERSGWPYAPMIGMWNLEISPDDGAGNVMKMCDADDTMSLLLCEGGGNVVAFSAEKTRDMVGAGDSAAQGESGALGNQGMHGDAEAPGKQGPQGGPEILVDSGISEGEVLVGALKMTLPESWRENLHYDILYDENSMSSFIRFYEVPDYLDFGGGWLCSLLQIEGNHPEDYNDLPHFEYLGEVVCPDGTVFGVVVEYPTDVQPSMENMELYGCMHEGIDKLFASIEPVDGAEYFVESDGF